MSRRDYWDSLPEATKAALRQIRDLDAQHLRLSGVAPPSVLASIRARRDSILLTLQETKPMTFQEIIAKAVAEAGSQTLLAEQLGIVQARISSWANGSSVPNPQRMREVTAALGYDWSKIRVQMLESRVAIKVPSYAAKFFRDDPDLPESVARKAWLAAGAAFREVILEWENSG